MVNRNTRPWLSGTSLTERQRVPFLLALSLALLALWAFYAVGLRPLIPLLSPPQEELVGWMARTTFWLVPCFVYLRLVRRSSWSEPLALGFPGGRKHMLLAGSVTLVVGILLFLGTAQQRGIAPVALALAFGDQAYVRLTAPLFEELVFRGVILSETMAIAASGTRRAGVRWGALGIGQALAALLFTLIHWPWWIMQRGMTATVTDSVPLFTTGLVLGLVFHSTKSIWPCVILHWFNNELSRLVH